MLDLLPGTNLGNLRASLDDTRNRLSIPRSGIGLIDRFNLYNEWAANAVNALRYQLSADDLDRLITTRLYWELFGKNPVDLGSALPSLIDNEMSARDAALLAELGLFDADVSWWHNGQAVAIVPDTSVLIEFGGAFPHQDWHTLLGIRPHIPVLLVVTMAAVTELDRKKLSRDNDAHGKSVRAGVRGALRRIEDLFPTNESRRDFTHREVITSKVTTVLLTDSLGHIPLPSADAEMISRALAVLPYAGRSILVTYDLAQTFRARSAGIEAHRLTYPFEDEPVTEGGQASGSNRAT